MQRGFATTSIPAKKAKATANSESAQQSDETISKSINPSTSSAAVHTEACSAEHNVEAQGRSPSEDTWDDDDAINNAAYQAIIDRLQDKADKEVARILKVRGRLSIQVLTFPVHRL